MMVNLLSDEMWNEKVNYLLKLYLALVLKLCGGKIFAEKKDLAVYTNQD